MVMQNSSINIGRVLIAVGIVVIIAFLSWYIVDGKYWTTIPSLPDSLQLAKKILERRGTTKDCFKSYEILPSYPPLNEKQFLCVSEYAKLTGDPTACDLMPIGYIQSCLRGTMHLEPCGFFYEPNKEIRGQGKITTYDQCLSGPADIRNYSCCVMARISKNPDSKENCSSFQTDELKDQCHHEIAKRDKNVAECAEMKNPTNRTGCEVGVRALQKQ